MSDNKKENRNDKKRRNERAERDSSPSARSQSSVSAILEWDPSADVGTRFRPPPDPQRIPRTTEVSPGPSTLERIAINLSSGFGHSDNDGSLISRSSQHGRSRSEEENYPADENVRSSRSQRSLSLVDLGTMPDRKDLPTPTPLAIRSVKNQEKNDVSSTGSAATVVSHSKDKRTEESRRHDFHSPVLVLRTPPQSRPGLLSATESPHPEPQSKSTKVRRRRQPESDANNEHDSTDDNGLTGRNEARRTTTRGMSEASTDWEYGPSRSHSHENDVSSLSDWQSSGVTRSEKLYRQRRPDSKEDTIGEQKNRRDDGRQYRRSSIDNIGYFDEDISLDEREGVKLQYRRSSVDNVGYFDVEDEQPVPPQVPAVQPEAGHRRSHTNNAKSQPQKKSELRLKSPARVTRSTQFVPQRKTHAERAQQLFEGIENLPRRPHQHRRRDTEVPSLTNSSDDVESSRPTTGATHPRSLDVRSNLSSTCNVLLNLARKSAPPTDQDMIATLIVHRDSHVKRFKKEMHQLTEINSFLETLGIKMPKLPGLKSSSSTSDSSPSDGKPTHKRPHRHHLPEPQAHHSRHPPPIFDRKGSSKDKHRQPTPDKERQHKTRDLETQTTRGKTVKNQHQRGFVNERTQTSFSTVKSSSGSAQSRTSSASSTRPDQSHHRATTSKYTQYSTPPSSASNGSRPESQDSMSFLVDKMNLLTDICILRENIPTDSDEVMSEQNESSFLKPPAPRKRGTKKQPSPTKNKYTLTPKLPVSFYIPFPGCERHPDPALAQEDMYKVPSQYTLRQVYEQLHPDKVYNMKRREEILVQMREERERRAEIKKNFFLDHPNEDLSGLDKVLPPKGIRLMTSREMKELNKRNYSRLAEVQEKIYLRSILAEKRANRQMSQVFAHNLKKKVLRGEKNHHHSRSIIRG